MIPSDGILELEVEALEIEADLRVVGAMMNRQQKQWDLEVWRCRELVFFGFWFTGAVGKKKFGEGGVTRGMGDHKYIKALPLVESLMAATDDRAL